MSDANARLEGGDVLFTGKYFIDKINCLINNAKPCLSFHSKIFIQLQKKTSTDTDNFNWRRKRNYYNYRNKDT